MPCFFYSDNPTLRIPRKMFFGYFLIEDYSTVAFDVLPTSPGSTIGIPAKSYRYPRIFYHSEYEEG